MSMDVILAIVLIMHLVGVMIPAMVEKTVRAVVGKEVVLPCSAELTTGSIQFLTVNWKYKETLVIRYRNVFLKGSAPMKERSQFNLQEITKGNFSLILSDPQLSDEGYYSCEFDKHKTTVELQVFQVKVSPSGFLLAGETLSLKLESSSNTKLVPVMWLDPQSTQVMNTVSRILTDNGRSLQIKDLRVQDNGIWKCSIDTMTIPFSVTVIGVVDEPDSRTQQLAAINATVSFSFLLNIDLNQAKTLGVGDIYTNLSWKSKEHDTYQEISNFKITDQDPVWQERMRAVRVLTNTESQLVMALELSKVQFKDAGWYRYQVQFNRGHLEKTFHLMVMTVSADPPEPISKGAEVTLRCELSTPLPKGAVLCWDRVNGTKEESHQTETKHVLEVKARIAGLWQCSLKQGSSVKMCIDYKLEEAAEWKTHLLIGAGVGGGAVLLLLVGLCVFVCTARKRRRQRAQKMALARQHLLDKKTCQCSHLRKNGYFET
uniref:Ig-like domain-containing protein n=1 Tax=Sphenodon punctatus TaxID=8508 RepID=A0A8D0H6N0_SPHPU